MAEYGFTPGASIYIADSAFVTAKNLAKAVENDIRFLSRLPANFKECKKAISEAISAESWLDIGTMTESSSEKRPAAFYRHHETTVTIDGRSYRAIVIHSSAYDKRRNKRIDRILKGSKTELDKKIKETIPQPFKCRPDAEAAAKALARSNGKSLHRMRVDITEVPKYGRGRPKNWTMC